MLNRCHWVTTLLIAAIAANASAQTATFQLSRTMTSATAGTFTLRLSVSDGDNFGVASYGVKLTGDITFDHRTPDITLADGSAGNDQPAGFTLFRAADQNSTTSGLLVTASQDTVSLTPYIYYGVGQTAGNVLTSPTDGPITIDAAGDSSQDADYAASIVIGTGTWNGQAPAFEQADVDNGVQVFTSDANVDTAAASLAFDVITITKPSKTAHVPMSSPAALAALAALIAGLGAWAMRRRQHAAAAAQRGSR